MMSGAKIFQNAWDLMRGYRSLWIFGVILALTTVSFGSTLWLRGEENQADRTLVNWQISRQDQVWIKEAFGLDLPQRYTLKVEDLQIRLDDPVLASAERARLLRLTAISMAVAVVLLTAALVLRYTAETALVRMVDDRQYRDLSYGARKGWSIGFSATALKFFLIDLVGTVFLLTVTMVLPLPALLPLFIAIIGSTAAISASLLLMTSLMLACLALMIPLWIAGLVSIQLAKRACALEELGVFASLWRGFRLMRTRLQEVGLTFLVIAGMDLVYPVLIAPIGILLAAVGLAVGGGLALLLGALLSLAMAKATAWTVAGIVGLVLITLSVVVPLAWLGGLRETFMSAAWTLTFREAVNAREAEQAPAPDGPLQQPAAA